MSVTAPTVTTIRVLLVDDHSVIRSALRLLIENQPALKVIGEAADVLDAVTIAVREQPDIILLDLKLKGVNALDFLPEVIRAAAHSRVIILTGVDDPAAHRQAVRLGAKGLVHKEKAPDVLIKAIEKVYAGETWFDRALMSDMLEEMYRRTRPERASPEATDIATLTEREREVIALVGEGLKNKQIAGRLFIAETTVRHHLTSAFSKLKVADRIELLIYSYRHGLAKAPR